MRYTLYHASVTGLGKPVARFAMLSDAQTCAATLSQVIPSDGKRWIVTDRAGQVVHETF